MCFGECVVCCYRITCPSKALASLSCAAIEPTDESSAFFFFLNFGPPLPLRSGDIPPFFSPSPPLTNSREVGVGCRSFLPVMVDGESDLPCEERAVPTLPEGDAVVVRPLVLCSTATMVVVEGEIDRAGPRPEGEVALRPPGAALLPPV